MEKTDSATIPKGAVYIVYTCIYNLYFHNLKHFPGPRLAAATPVSFLEAQTSDQKPTKTLNSSGLSLAGAKAVVFMRSKSFMINMAPLYARLQMSSLTAPRKHGRIFMDQVPVKDSSLRVIGTSPHRERPMPCLQFVIPSITAK